MHWLGESLDRGRLGAGCLTCFLCLVACDAAAPEVLEVEEDELCAAAEAVGEACEADEDDDCLTLYCSGGLGACGPWSLSVSVKQDSLAGLEAWCDDLSGPGSDPYLVGLVTFSCLDEQERTVECSYQE